MLRTVTIILLGLSGAGKTFLGKVLEALGFHLIDMSSELERRALEWQDEIGAILREWLNEGRANNVMVADHAVRAVLIAAIEEVKPGQSIVISGCPRTIEQAKIMAEVLESCGRRDGTRVITLDVSPEEALRRALKGDPNREARADSTPEKVRERHEIFMASNHSIRAALVKQQVCCTSINANGGKIKTTIALLTLIEPLLESNTQ